MTDDAENWEAQERIAWEPKTPREEREPLGNAPLATLRATPATPQAFTLMGDLAKRYPRPQAAKGKKYARLKTLDDYANATGAFIADLLAAIKRDRSEGWVMRSHNKGDYTGQYVSWSMFPDVDEVLGCIGSRATLWGEGVIGENEAKVFSLPLPVSLSGVRGPRKLSVTLAWFTPVQSGRRAYRGVRLKVEEPEYKAICTRALDGQPDRKPRGTIYHRFWEGMAARNFVAGDTVELRVARDPDQGDQLPDLIRFGLAATLETDDDTLPIYEEVRAPLAVQPRVPVIVAR
jgi:hypothetical protein